MENWLYDVYHYSSEVFDVFDVISQNYIEND